MYGLVHEDLLWSKTYRVELEGKGFERCQADSFLFRRVLLGNVVVIIVVFVDARLVASATKRDKQQAKRDLYFCFPIKAWTKLCNYSDIILRKTGMQER